MSSEITDFRRHGFATQEETYGHFKVLTIENLSKFIITTYFHPLKSLIAVHFTAFFWKPLEQLLLTIAEWRIFAVGKTLPLKNYKCYSIGPPIDTAVFFLWFTELKDISPTQWQHTEQHRTRNAELARGSDQSLLGPQSCPSAVLRALPCTIMRVAFNEDKEWDS